MSPSTASEQKTDSSSRLEQVGGRLSPRAQETIEKIESLLAEGRTQDEVAAMLALPKREVERARAELREEALAIEHGAELPDLSKEARAGLVDSIAELTQLVPILLDEEGNVLDGHNRMAVCTELGIEPLVHTVETHGDPEIRRQIALAANTARRSLSPADRRKVIAAEIIFDPERSDRAIAAALGVGNHTVARVRAELEEAGAVLRFEERRGRDGVAQKARRPRARKAKPSVAPELVVRVGFIDQREVNGIAFVASGVRLYIGGPVWSQLENPAQLELVLRAVKPL